jgi:hypothetical protein
MSDSLETRGATDRDDAELTWNRAFGILNDRYMSARRRWIEGPGTVQEIQNANADLQRLYRKHASLGSPDKSERMPAGLEIVRSRLQVSAIEPG